MKFSLLSAIIFSLASHAVSASPFEQGLRRANTCAFQDEPIARDNGDFVGCVKVDGRKCGEDLRFIAEGEKCDRNEQTVTWNEQGPPGPPGLVQINKVVAPKQRCNLGSNRESCDVSVHCPSGQIAISGGFRRTSGTDELALRFNTALGPDVNPTGWRVAGDENLGRGGLEIEVFVLCAQVN